MGVRPGHPLINEKYFREHTSLNPCLPALLRPGSISFFPLLTLRPLLLSPEACSSVLRKPPSSSFFFLFVCFFSSRLFISEDTLALPTSSFSSLAHTPPISLPPLHGHELAKFTVDPMDIQLYIFTICTKCFISQCISFMESSKSWPLYRKKKSRASRVKDICLKIYR